MAGQPELRLIIYDIANDRRRRRVAEALEERAARVQESAFEARLSVRHTIALMTELKALLGPGDSLRLYTVPDQAIAKCAALGGGPPPNGGRYWLV